MVVVVAVVAAKVLEQRIRTRVIGWMRATISNLLRRVEKKTPTLAKILTTEKRSMMRKWRCRERTLI